MTLEEILHNKNSILDSTQRPLALFKEYLKTGYYPFSEESDFWDKLASAVSTTLENDIPQYARMTLGTIKNFSFS
ncbi:MAG: hypothetical protein LIP09_03180 [Bacteroidales bacterium]|nr:hypothetical protein [Bacteroidales bacterium]